ncbi:MAG: transcription antitermination factor NusB [Chloroflexi bacterium]|nr:transcription antitermination factor NusB [Chloroflexota bacterium]
MAGVRRKARMVALQALYEIDCARHDPRQTLTRLLEESTLPPEGREFAEELVIGVVAHREAIDAVIRRTAPLWPLAQIAAIDRNILRLAIYEILFDNKVPLRAAINEAVELAKLFGSESSPRFVNGVLGTVSTHARSSSSS